VQNEGFSLLPLHFLKEGTITTFLDFLFAACGTESFLHGPAEPTGRMTMIDAVRLHMNRSRAHSQQQGPLPTRLATTIHVFPTVPAFHLAAPAYHTEL
jgi:hypothetical protein